MKLLSPRCTRSLRADNDVGSAWHPKTIFKRSHVILKPQGCGGRRAIENVMIKYSDNEGQRRGESWTITTGALPSISLVAAEGRREYSKVKAQFQRRRVPPTTT
jgi:hypothetical protein